ncbi:MAG: hypothetical protein GXX91_09875 [Verrucomicrobiaceae bacterium]|mgnify:CR=1 FL=1|nr:hypothetical protein [Verrucomicrobiaceae bacterium]
MTPPSSETEPAEAAGSSGSTETPLRLTCPDCGGALHLHRRHLGVTGRCVHCETPLTAWEQQGSVRLLTGFDPDHAATPNAVPTQEQVAAPPFQQSLLFRDVSAEDDGSISSLFRKEEDSSQITLAWGTKIPRENHSPISPFATGSAGGGFAESLFREKVTKVSPATPPARETGEARVADEEDAPPASPATRTGEPDFTTHLFSTEQTRRQPRWVRKSIQVLLALFVLVTVGAGVFFATPEEKIATWKEKTYAWFEPGLAALDYVPEGLRPDSLPRTPPVAGDDDGNDGEASKGLNVFDGLKKMDGEIDGMRAAAEEELGNLNRL